MCISIENYSFLKNIFSKNNLEIKNTFCSSVVRSFNYINNFNLYEIKSYYYFKSSRWDLNKEDNITIKLPFSNYEQSLKQYKILEDEGKIYKNSIVDLRVPKKIIISYKWNKNGYNNWSWLFKSKNYNIWSKKKNYF